MLKASKLGHLVTVQHIAINNQKRGWFMKQHTSLMDHGPIAICHSSQTQLLLHLYSLFFIMGPSTWTDYTIYMNISLHNRLNIRYCDTCPSEAVCSLNSWNRSPPCVSTVHVAKQPIDPWRISPLKSGILLSAHDVMLPSLDELA